MVMHLSKCCPTYPHASNVGEYEGVISLTLVQIFSQIPFYNVGLKFVTNILEYTGETDQVLEQVTYKEEDFCDNDYSLVIKAILY